MIEEEELRKELRRLAGEFIEVKKLAEEWYRKAEKVREKIRRELKEEMR